MAEYIDREALYEKAYWHGEHPDVGNPFPDGVEAIDIKDVDAIPAADVAPVVRCKHCTDGIMSNDNKYIICCRLGVGMEFDDFCSHGERKDEGIGYVAD